LLVVTHTTRSQSMTLQRRQRAQSLLSRSTFKTTPISLESASLSLISSVLVRVIRAKPSPRPASDMNNEQDNIANERPGIISRGFQYVFDKQWRDAHPNVTRWYSTVYNQPIYSAVVDPLSFIDEAVKYTPPAKAPKPAAAPAPKAAPKPKAKEVEEEDDEPVEAPKAKHPLSLLPKPTLDLDEWKRQYSNNDTPDALKWFWANYNPEEYSLWKIDYKYNDELTQVFMSSNLVGGFFARLEGSRKYIFGCASVYGEKDNSVIQGAFVIRGQEALPAFDVAPDYESYEFTKLDHTKPEDQEFVNEQWTWEKPVTVGGKTYPWADGKVFK